jgi:hypothetical protein
MINMFSSWFSILNSLIFQKICVKKISSWMFSTNLASKPRISKTLRDPAIRISTMVPYDEFFHVHLEFQVDFTKTFCLKI